MTPDRSSKGAFALSSETATQPSGHNYVVCSLLAGIFAMHNEVAYDDVACQVGKAYNTLFIQNIINKDMTTYNKHDMLHIVTESIT